MIGSNRPRTIIAAARQVQLGKLQRIGKPWQENLWNIYENLGPVHYGMGFKRAAAQRVNYFAAERTEDTDEPIPTENEQVMEAVDRLGDLGDIVGNMVIQENVAGEGYLYAKDEDEEEWEVLSTVEVNSRRQAGDDSIREDDYLLRIWRASPRKHSDPDSPLRSVQAQCEQLLLLNDQIGATAMSRIPAGLLLMPDELSFPAPAEDPPDTGANIDNDPFMSELIEVISTAIKDPDSAARVAPNLIRGPAELLKEVRFIDFSRDMDEVFANMREELLRQIAGGINLPAEILTGLADLNHWSLWGVDESTAKHHVDPDVLHICQGLTMGFLWPTLEEMGVSDFKRYMIWRDYSDLTARPLSVEQALAMNEAGIVNDEYVRRIANVPEDMAGPGRPTVSEPISPDPQANREIPDTLVAAAVDISPLTAIDSRLATQITEASEAAFERAMERAGAKIRAKARKDRQVSALIDGIDNRYVAKTLGAKRTEQFQLTPDQLIPADTFDPLAERLDKVLTQGQDDTRSFLSRLFGRRVEKKPEEDESRLSAIRLFISALFAATTARLFTDSPDLDPAETGEFSEEIATGQMVTELLTRAGGEDIERFTPETPRGLALGQRTRAALRDNGYRIEAETWRWGYYRTPTTPYEPHLGLSGITVEDREDPRLGGYWPGDHRFCTCEFVPTVLPAD